MLDEVSDIDSNISDDYIPNMHHSTIQIGYYRLRGKAQVPRLLCQYLNVDYEDSIFTYREWLRYKEDQAAQWDFKDNPFLKQGDFVVTEPIPMCMYIIKRFGSPDLLGNTLRDKAIVSMYIWTIDSMGSFINILCQKKSAQEMQIFKQQQWSLRVAPRLKKYEQIAKQNDWFLGYFTLIDLSMYELIRYFNLIFPGKMDQFPKLKDIEVKVANLPKIKQYQLSERAIKQIDPTILLEQVRALSISQTQAPAPSNRTKN